MKDYEPLDHVCAFVAVNSFVRCRKLNGPKTEAGFFRALSRFASRGDTV